MDSLKQGKFHLDIRKKNQLLDPAGIQSLKYPSLEILKVYLNTSHASWSVAVI